MMKEYRLTDNNEQLSELHTIVNNCKRGWEVNQDPLFLRIWKEALADIRRIIDNDREYQTLKEKHNLE